MKAGSQGQGKVMMNYTKVHILTVLSYDIRVGMIIKKER